MLSIARKQYKQFAIFTQQNNKNLKAFRNYFYWFGFNWFWNCFICMPFDFICLAVLANFTEMIRSEKHKFRDNACGAFFARLKISYSLIIASAHTLLLLAILFRFIHWHLPHSEHYIENLGCICFFPTHRKYD